MKQFVNFCGKLSPLDDLSMSALSSILEVKSVKKGEAIVQLNTHCHDLFFIKKGIVKMCFNSGGKEFIMRFFEENILFTDLESCIQKKHSKYEVIAIEDTELIVISYSKFEKLSQNHHKLETFFRKLMTMASLNMMARISEMLEEDAKNRYYNFTKKYPELLQRISLGDLSNYLGITQVSLSRIRAIK